MKGTLKVVNIEKQFGFITAEDGGTDVHCYFSDFVGVKPIPSDRGALVEFELTVDDRGRHGKSVSLSGESGGPPRREPRGIYFDSGLLPAPDYEYVCWLDVMGTENQMLRSLKISANFVFKLHCAVLEAMEELGWDSNIKLYPVMDGVYITSARKVPLQDLVNQVLSRVSITFLREKMPFHQFLVRGAIAFGPIYHGAALDPGTSIVLAKHPEVRDSILLGQPMAEAHAEEREACPFGVAIHPSARAFAPFGDEPFPFVALEWYNHCDPKIDPAELLKKLEEYFTYQLAHSMVTGYKEDRIIHHQRLAKQFFTLDQDKKAFSARP